MLYLIITYIFLISMSLLALYYLSFLVFILPLNLLYSPLLYYFILMTFTLILVLLLSMFFAFCFTYVSFFILIGSIVCQCLTFMAYFLVSFLFFNLIFAYLLIFGFCTALQFTLWCFWLLFDLYGLFLVLVSSTSLFCSFFWIFV